MTELILSEVTIEAHRVAEEVVKREIHTASLEMQHVVHKILNERLGDDHDKDHVWVKVSRDASDALKHSAQSTIIKSLYNMLAYLVVAGITYTVITVTGG